MTIYGNGPHHANVRKRIHIKHEEFPHAHPLKRFLDKGIYVISIVGPVLTIPQVTKIWIEKSATGLSIITWSTYLFCALFWLSYGLAHKEKPIIVNNSIWIILNILIIIGIILY